MKSNKPSEQDRAICPSCNRAWVDHPGLKQTCEERNDLRKESEEFRSLSILLHELSKQLIAERDELRKERDELRQTIDALALNIKHSQGVVATLQQENSELQERLLYSKVEELTAILREVEWSKDSLGCPVCQWTVRTHKYDCRLAKALKGERV